MSEDSVTIPREDLDHLRARIVEVRQERRQLIIDLMTLRDDSDNPLTPSEVKLLYRASVIKQELQAVCDLLGLDDCTLHVLLRHLRNNYSAALGALHSTISGLELQLESLTD